jgi:cell division protein FtsQ
MLKKIFGILAVLLVLAYLIFAIVHFSGDPSAKKCTSLTIVLKDENAQAYVSPAEIREILTNRHCRIVGKQLRDIDFQRIEHLAETHKMVSRAECFSTPSGQVMLNIWQVSPVLRIMQDGGSYYIDEKGQRSGISFNSAADVPVASGVICDSLSVRRLYRMAMLLRNDLFWNAQIEQIYVEPNGEWLLIPCVGDYEIEFGLPNEVEDKLQRLRLFYQKALPKVGWERYSKISVKYKNQIVCTKKEE